MSTVSGGSSTFVSDVSSSCTFAFSACSIVSAIAPGSPFSVTAKVSAFHAVDPVVPVLDAAVTFHVAEVASGWLDSVVVVEVVGSVADVALVCDVDVDVVVDGAAPDGGACVDPRREI